MVPMRTSTIFKSRWMVLVWAAGVILAALNFAASDQPADLTGATISDEQAKNFAQR